MFSKIKRLVCSPADLIAVYLFTFYHYVRFRTGWPARKFYLTVVFLIALVWELIRVIKRRQLNRFRPDATDAVAFLLGLSIVLTAVFSKYGYLAYDPKNPEEGALIWCVYLGIFFLFRRQYMPKKTHLMLFLISGYIECLLMIINTCVYNLFGVNSSLYGNYNLLGMGMSVLYAVNLLLLRDESDPVTCFIHYFLAFFFSMGIILSRSDNTLVCVAALLGTLPFLYEIDPAFLKKLIRLAAILFFAMAAVHLLTLLPVFEKKNLVSCVLLDLSRKLSPALTASAGLIVLTLERLIPKERSLPHFTRVLRILVIALVVLLATGFVLSNLFGISLGAADRIFRIDDSWGSDRGLVWRTCLATYGQFGTPMQKLFGAGINSTPYYTWDHLPWNIQKMQQNYCTPHNFLLQWLLEGGVCGLILFLLFCFLTLKGCLRHNDRFKTMAAVMAAVILAGWLITVPSPDFTPYFIVFLAICAAPGNICEVTEQTDKPLE